MKRVEIEARGVGPERAAFRTVDISKRNPPP
jgi:hypothetical protein